MKNCSVALLALFGLSLGAPLLAQADEVGMVVNEYTTNGGVEFIPNLDPTQPVDPENPDPENPVVPIDPVDPETGPQPGTPGPLSIDFASSLDFGINQISNKTMTYYARAQTFGKVDGEGNPIKDPNGLPEVDTEFGKRPNYVQVTDNRGSGAGWTLTVRQNGQFTATDKEALYQVLDGSEIELVNPKHSTVMDVAEGQTPTPTPKINLDPTGGASVVLRADKNQGAGTWVNSWGEVETIQDIDEEGKAYDSDVTKAISLTVPGTTPKSAVNYRTTLTWELQDTPN